MKKKDLKQLLQNLIFTNNSTKLTELEISDKFPELVEISQTSNPDGLNLYRILKIKEGNEHYDFAFESTSKSLSACAQIADSMPSMVHARDGMKSLDTIYFSFEVPKENILIDFDAVLPVMKIALNKQMNHSIEDRYGELMKIKEAFEMIEESNEREVLAQLKDLPYKKTKYNNDFSLSANLFAYEKGADICLYKEDLNAQLESIKKIMPEKELNAFINWKEKKIEVNPKLKNLKRRKYS